MKGLEPCPFCGGEAWIREKTLRLLGRDPITRKTRVRIAMYCYCGKCKARGGVATGTYTFVTYITNKDREDLKRRAIEAWNRRASETCNNSKETCNKSAEDAVNANIEEGEDA